MILRTNTSEYLFRPVTLTFQTVGISELFAKKNNRTVLETLQHKRYQALYKEVIQKYPGSLQIPLGIFLGELKSSGDTLYQRFLNKCGDEVYSIFGIRDIKIQKLKGLYCYAKEDVVMYIDRCNDTYGKRINQGYGNITPKNCYRDGQSTNCHLNSLITKYQMLVSFYIFPLQVTSEINRIERELIITHQPEWNIALRHSLRHTNDAG